LRGNNCHERVSQATTRKQAAEEIAEESRGSAETVENLAQTSGDQAQISQQTGRQSGAAAEVADGEALILRPDGAGGAQVLARDKIEEWP
jgi:hypothetical protein